jgi:hypothetical protein
MSTEVEGYVPNSNVSPHDPDAIGGVGPAVGFVNGSFATLASDGTGTASIQFDGTEEEGIKAAEQYGLDGVIEPGSSYLVHVKARETGNGASWEQESFRVRLVNSLGMDHGQVGNLWGVDTGRHISGTWQDFVVVVNASTEEGTNVPNSIGAYIFPTAGLAMKKLEVDLLKVEPIVGI